MSHGPEVLLIYLTVAVLLWALVQVVCGIVEACVGGLR